uniref:Uncharacterized protein n=1 Tax=Arundo donax TaxID=35708 RepID=A0A0A9I1Y9_ARUDO
MEVDSPREGGACEINLAAMAVRRQDGMGSHLAVDKVPKGWKLDPKWESEVGGPRQQLSHHWASSPDPVASVRGVDHFTIERTKTPDIEPTC